MEKTGKDNQRFFSVELNSKKDLKNLTLTNGPLERVLIEGSIGELLHAAFEEDVLLEVAGTKGTLRINLRESELKKPQSIPQEIPSKEVDA
ncbi:MAG: hypothetical protein ACQCN6_03335 [Candidatus Bathyarchaeia archaeon]|jgi:hypothetical protein